MLGTLLAMKYDAQIDEADRLLDLAERRIGDVLDAIAQRKPNAAARNAHLVEDYLRRARSQISPYTAPDSSAGASGIGASSPEPSSARTTADSPTAIPIAGTPKEPGEQQGRPDLPSGEAGVRTSVAQVNNKWHAILSVGHQSFYLHALDGTEDEANEFARIVRDAFSAAHWLLSGPSGSGEEKPVKG